MATASVTARNAAVDAVALLLDAGTSRASLTIFDNPFTLFACNTFVSVAEPSWGAAVGGVASRSGGVLISSFSSSVAVCALANLNSNPAGIAVISNITVGLPGSGADIIMANTNVRAGQSLRVTQLDLQML